MPEEPAQPEPPVLSGGTPPLSGWSRWVALALVTGGLVAVVLVHFYEPVANRGLYPQCGFKQATGLDCPGCGGLRSVHALTHGRLGESFRFHPAIFLSLPLLGWLGVQWLREWRRTGVLPVPLAHPSANRPLIWIAVVFISVGVARLIPAKPFSYLATPPVPAAK